MLYITGKEETLEQLRIMEKFQGSLKDYQKKFAELNPSLCSKFPGYATRLPSFVLINLVNEPIIVPEHSKEIAQIVNTFDESEREMMRMLQDDKFDILSLIKANLIVDDFNAYLAQNPISLMANRAATNTFQKSLTDWSQGNLDEKDNWLSQPIVSTSYDIFDKAVTQDNLLDWSSRIYNRGVVAVEMSPAYQAKNTFFELMKRRLEVNLWHEEFKRGVFKAGKGDIQALVREAQQLTRQMKALMNEQIAINEVKITHGPTKSVLGYTLEEARKLRTNALSIKEAKQGEEAVARLLVERLNKTGLKLFQNILKGLKSAGTGIGTAVTTVGVVQSINAVTEEGRKGGNMSCKAAGEVAGFYANMWMLATAGGSLVALGSRMITPTMVTTIGTGVAALGGLLFQSGFVGLGSAILTCIPGVGWVALGIAGGVALALFTNSAKEITNQSCVAMTEVSKSLSEKIYDFASDEYQKLMNFFNGLAYEANREFEQLIRRNMYPMGR